MATFPTLSGGPIKLGELRETYRRSFISIIDQYPGQKAIVVDPLCSGALANIERTEVLKEHLATPCAMDRFDHSKCDPAIKTILFFARPNVRSMKAIADIVHERPNMDYHLYCVPRVTFMCDEVLAHEGVTANVSKHIFPVHFVPIDDDVISLELSESFKELYLDGDWTSLFYASKGLMHLQDIYGIIPNVHGVGKMSRQIIEMMKRMMKERAGDLPALAPEIENIVLVDRSVDLVTPMLTQLTYEGIIDEIMHITTGYVKNDPLKPGAIPDLPKGKILLNNTDPIFAEIRDENFTVIGPMLHEKATKISQAIEERKTLEQKGFSDIKQYVQNLPKLQAEQKALSVHASLSKWLTDRVKEQEFQERIDAEQSISAGMDIKQEYIEECVYRRKPLYQVLRLFALESLCFGGLKPKTFDYLRREIIYGYGFDKMLMLYNMERCGLLERPQSKPAYPQLRKLLNLRNEQIDEKNPNDMAYAYSGHAPLSCRLIERLFKKGWADLAEPLRTLCGDAGFSEKQELPAALKDSLTPNATVDSSTPKKRVTLVLFVGGITRAEMSVLRFMFSARNEALTDAERDKMGDLLIGTTNILVGDDVVASMNEEFSGTPSSD